MNEKGKRFYEFVKSKGIKVPDSYDEFSIKMQDKETADKFRQFVSSKGIKVPETTQEFQSVFSSGEGETVNFTNASSEQSEGGGTTALPQESLEQQEKGGENPSPLTKQELPVGVAAPQNKPRFLDTKFEYVWDSGKPKTTEPKTEKQAQQESLEDEPKIEFNGYYEINGKPVEGKELRSKLLDRDFVNKLQSGAVNVQIKDDDHLQALAQKQFSSGSELGDKWEYLQSGIYRLGAGVEGLPAYIADGIEEITGVEIDQGVVTPARVNAALLAVKSKEAIEKTREYESGFLESIEKGNFADAFNQGNNMILNSAPVTAYMAVTGGAGLPVSIASSIPILSSSEYATQEVEGLDKGDRLIRATAFGTAEAFGEAVTGGITRSNFNLFKEGYKKLVKEAAKTGNKQAIAEVAERSSKELLKNTLKSYGIDTQKEGVSEVLTGVVQDLTDDILGVKEMGFEDYVDNALENYAAGAYMGGVLGTGRIAGASMQIARREIIDPNKREKIINDVNRKAENGEITPQQAQEVTEVIQNEGEALDAIPEDMLSNNEVFELEKRKKQLEKEIEGKDPALTQGKRDEINQIEKDLNDIANGRKQQTQESKEGTVRDREQEQTTQKETKDTATDETEAKGTRGEQQKELSAEDGSRGEEDVQGEEVETPTEEAKQRATDFGFSSPREVRNSAKKNLDIENAKVEDLTDDQLLSLQKNRVDREINGIIEKVKNRTPDKADPNKVNKRAFKDAVDYLQQTRWYELAPDTERESAYVDLAKKLNQPIRVSPSTKRVLGVPKPKKVTSTEKKLRDEFYKALNLGAAGAVSAQKETAASLKDFANQLEMGGRINRQQAKSITNAALGVNFNSPKSVERFVERAEKIAQDSQYAQDLSDAIKLRAKTRKKSKTKSLPVNLQDRLSEISNIDPKKVEDLDLYITTADQIYRATLPVGNKSYSPINEKEVAKNLFTLKKQEQLYIEQELKDALGYGDVEFTQQELEELLEAEDFDEYASNLSDAKTKSLRDSLALMAEYSKIGLENYTPPTDISRRNRDRLKELKTLDVDELSLEELRGYIRFVDNLVNNDSFDGIVPLVSKAVAEDRANRFLDSITPHQKQNLKDLGSVESETLGLQVMLKKVFSESTAAARFQEFSSIGKYFQGNKVKSDAYFKAAERYSKKLSTAKKKNKDVATFEANVERGVAAVMLQEGDKRIIQTIDTLKKEKSDEYELYISAIEKALDKFKGKDNDAIKKELGENAGLIDFWINTFYSVADEFETTSREVHNEKFVRESDNTYTPISIKKIFKSELDEGQTKYSLRDKIYKPKQSASAIKRRETPSLPKGSVLDLNFDRAMEKKYNEVLFDIHTSEQISNMRAFFANDKVRNIIGEKTADRISNMMQDAITNHRGKTPPLTEIERLVSDTSRLIRKVGYTAALGSVLQFPKQYVPVAFNTVLNLGKDSSLFFRSIDPTSPLFDKYSIGERGKTQGGLERGESYIDAQTKEIVGRGGLKGILGKIDNRAKRAEKSTDKVRDALFYGLRSGDVAVAKRAWAAYYMQYLRDNGVNIDNINWKTEHLNQTDLQKEAAQYAEQRVGETQVPSEFTQLPKLLQSQGKPMWDVVKNIFLPFSTFTVNAKGRMYADLGIIFDKNTTPQQTQDAARSLGATLGEIVLYQSINVFIIAAIRELGKTALLSLFGIDSDDEDSDDQLNFKLKKWYSNIIRDFLASGFSGFAEKGIIDILNGAGYVAKRATGENLSRADYNKDKPFYRYNDDYADLGTLAIVFELSAQADETLNTVLDIVTGKNPEIETKYGYKELNLTEEEERFMMLSFVTEVALMTGMIDAELARMVLAGKREIVRGKTKGSQPEAKPKMAPKIKTLY